MALCAQWEVGGYAETQSSLTRFRTVDRAALAEVRAVDLEDFAAAHGEWMEHAQREGQLQGDQRWSASRAVGSRAFAEGAYLGTRGRHRSIDDASILREPCGPSTPIFATEIALPSANARPETHVSRRQSGGWHSAASFKFPAGRTQPQPDGLRRALPFNLE